MSRPLSTMFIDFNAFFASVEQHLNPELRGKPVGVAPLLAETTCCIAASYQAKALGVKTGTSVREARRLCPGIHIVQSRPAEYVKMHHRFLEAITTVIPVSAVHSIDECSAQLMGRERDRAEAERLAREVKRALRERIGETLTCSIGIGPNRLLSKIAADLRKPDGLTTIDASEMPERLRDIELSDIPGVGSKMSKRLKERGIETFDQFWALSMAEMGALWGGVTGKIMHQRLRGEEPDTPPTRKSSIGHQHVLAPKLRNPEGARSVMIRLVHKVAARLRYEKYWARRLAISVRMVESRGEPSAWGWHGGGWGADAELPETQDTLTILETALSLWEGLPPGAPMQISVVTFDLSPHAEATIPLFPESENRVKLARAMDRINKSHGHDTVYFAGMHGAKDAAPMRIPFQTIPHLDLPDLQET